MSALPHIRVVVRARPPQEGEESEGWACGADEVVEVRRAERHQAPRRFAFDAVFDASATNGAVYGFAVRSIVEDAMLRGYHGCVLAYGQTSTGKTFTMQGTPDEPGAIPLAVEDCFDCMASTPGRDFAVKVAYLEVYNEQIRDLLRGDDDEEDEEDHLARRVQQGRRNFGGRRLSEGTKKGLITVVDDPRRPGSTVVRGAREVSVASVEEVFEVIIDGERRRQVGETVHNARSSRSHAILRLTVESSPRDGGGKAPPRQATLSLVDLAGSERVPTLKGASFMDANRLKEGAHINKSLHTLAHVVSCLSKTSDKKHHYHYHHEQQQQQQHVPFRDSKLTRILQPALRGAARVALICTIALAASHGDETCNTLKFAARTKTIAPRQSLVANDDLDPTASLLHEYRDQIAHLKHQLQALEEAKTHDEEVAEEARRRFQREDSSPPPSPPSEDGRDRATIQAAVSQLERLILKSEEVAASDPPTSKHHHENNKGPKKQQLAFQEGAPANGAPPTSPATFAQTAPAQHTFFADRKGRKGRSRTLPPRSAAPKPSAAAAAAAASSDDRDPETAMQNNPPAVPPPAVDAPTDLLRAMSSETTLISQPESDRPRKTAWTDLDLAATTRTFPRRQEDARAADLDPIVEPHPPHHPIIASADLAQIKTALEQVLAQEHHHHHHHHQNGLEVGKPAVMKSGANNHADHALRAELERVRADALFVLDQLDIATARNRELEAKVHRLTAILATREAELRELKGLASPEDEAF